MDNKSVVYYKKITSDHKTFDLKLDEVWAYKDLIILFTKRNFAVRYKQTILGPAWLFINPILSSLIYCFIFGGIAGMSTGEVPQMLFYLSGHAMWMYFSSCLTRNAETFTSNAAVFGKVYFPRLTTPLSNVLTSALEFFIQMIITGIFWLFYLVRGDVHPDWIMLCTLPFILIWLGLLGMGTGIIISSLTTKYRDLSILVGFAVSLWMYITPVVYPFSQSDKSYWLKMVLMINPVTAPMEVYRRGLLGDGQILTLALLGSALFTVIVTLLGIVIFNKVERTFMDTV